MPQNALKMFTHVRVNGGKGNVEILEQPLL